MRLRTPETQIYAIAFEDIGCADGALRKTAPSFFQISKGTGKNIMLTEKPAFKKWITVTAMLGFLAFMLYLVFFTDFAQVGTVIGGINPAIYVLAFLCVVVGSAFDALAWKATLDSLAVGTTFRRVFSLSWVGHFVDTLIPGGLSGDAFKTYLLTKDKDVNGSKAAASIIIKDVLELLVVLGSLVVGIALLVMNYSVNSSVMAAIGITMVFLALPLVVIVYLSVSTRATEKLLRAIERLVARIKGKQTNGVALQEKVHHQITEFREGILTIKNNPKAMFKPIVYQSLTWVFEVLSFFLVFIAIGSLIGIDKVVITNTIVNNVQGQGIALAGVSQIVSSELYQVLGITAGIAIASSLLAGFAGFWFKLVLSFGFFQVTVFERCIPFICNKCYGWTAWRTKSCPEPKPKRAKSLKPP
ncbi:MAG: lysylphosphatidylglycerol synthase transmembrane domain-containing protein [Candidatus Bathyarchaeia archaeon]